MNEIDLVTNNKKRLTRQREINVMFLILVWTALHEDKAPNVECLSAKPNSIGWLGEPPLFQYSSLKGYSGWSRHLWKGQIGQMSSLGEARYQITAIDLCPANLFLAIYVWPSWKALLLIHKLFCSEWLTLQSWKQACVLKERTVRDHFSGLQTAYLKERWGKSTGLCMSTILTI